MTVVESVSHELICVVCTCIWLCLPWRGSWFLFLSAYANIVAQQCKARPCISGTPVCMCCIYTSIQVANLNLITFTSEANHQFMHANLGTLMQICMAVLRQVHALLAGHLSPRAQLLNYHLTHIEAWLLVQVNATDIRETMLLDDCCLEEKFSLTRRMNHMLCHIVWQIKATHDMCKKDLINIITRSRSTGTGSPTNAVPNKVAA